jgi:hypothetical protein
MGFVPKVPRLNGAEVVVTEPRLRCSKLLLTFGRSDMVKRVQMGHRMTAVISLALNFSLMAALNGNNGHSGEVDRAGSVYRRRICFI